MSKIVLYEDDHLRGKALETEGSISDLKKDGFGDKTSSILVVEGKWIVYKDANYKGDSWIVEVNGGLYNRGVYVQPSDWGGGNDNISSLRPV